MRLFLKSTAGEARGGADAEVYGCARGVWHQEQLPTTPGWGIPWSCQVQETEPSRVLRAPWARLLVQVASCLTPLPNGQGHLSSPLLAGWGQALHPAARVPWCRWWCQSVWGGAGPTARPPLTPVLGVF